jgi:gamma-carbonic anhydrase
MNDSDQLIHFSGRAPLLGRDVFLAPGARLVGDVRLGDQVSVWFNAVLRGDIHFVEIGDGSNIQDNVTCHVDDDHPCVVGRDVVVGHAAVLHGCTIEDRCLIGMSSSLLNGVVVGERSVVAAGAVVAPHTKIPPGKLAIGVPARIKDLPDGFWDREVFGDAKYRRLAKTYLKGIPYLWPDPEWQARDAEQVARRGPSPRRRTAR